MENGNKSTSSRFRISSLSSFLINVLGLKEIQNPDTGKQQFRGKKNEGGDLPGPRKDMKEKLESMGK